MIVPSDNVDISTSGTTQSLPTLDAERTIGEPTAESSIETDTEPASLSTPDSVMLTCDTSETFVVLSAVANATAKLLSVSAFLSTFTTYAGDVAELTFEAVSVAKAVNEWLPSLNVEPVWSYVQAPFVSAVTGLPTLESPSLT